MSLPEGEAEEYPAVIATAQGGIFFDWFQLVCVLILLAGAALAHFVFAPAWLALSPGYASQTTYEAEGRLRATPSGEWQQLQLAVWRKDQTLVNTGPDVVIQSDLHWIEENNQVFFENSGLYGVERRTRQNVPGYGDQPRTGQFLFPRHVQKTTYSYWDSMFIGLRSASYDHSESLGGLELYVFRFSGSDMDETAGYSYLPDVPEHYDAHTDGQGQLWFEPLSGTVVDYEEQGVSYYIDQSTGERVASFFEWRDRYTPATKAAQLALARRLRLRSQALENWLPGGLLLVGLLLLVLDLNRRIEQKRRRV
jgi:hypothetical protein